MVASETVLDALGSATRRSIVQFLHAGPAPVGEIARALPVSRPAVSQHLRVLEDARLVKFTAEGNKKLYALDPTGFEAARSWLDAFWSEGLHRFAALAASSWEDGDV